jgi:serine/threonine-protein kinase
MGAVYLAQQTRPVRGVAVKILRPSVATQQEFLVRFRREADLIARLDHVNIMPIYEYGEQDGLAYLVMPYLTGGSLRDKLAQHGPLPFAETLTYIDQAAAALDYAHARKIIHRDIKPGNFLFHADGRLVLADFGIAHMVREDGSPDTTLTGTGQFLGSPEYMAPEMVYGEPVDPRTDVYELGIVLFQMLSGRVPFQGSSPFMIATKHVQETAPLLYQLNPAIPPAVDMVVRKAIAKQPADRYISAGELARALRAAIITPASISIEPLPNSSPTFLSHPSPVVPPADTPNYIYSQSAAMQSSSPAAVVSRESHVSRGVPSWLAWSAVIFVALLALGGAWLLGIQFMKAFGQHPAATPTTVAPAPQPTHTFSPTPLPSPTPTPSPTHTPSPTPTLSPTSVPAPSPSQQAQTVVQRYYNAINQSDYQTAYQQWGTAYQNANPYNQFASGFANTRHDDLVMNSVTLLSDGTVKVAITLYATEQSSSGTAVKKFQGYYIVGQENGKWHLLSASIQQVG